MSHYGWTDKRPMSPHMSVWRWHITMLGSILHRVTGMAAYVGVMLVVAWLFSAMLGEEAYDRFASVMGTIPMQVILFGFTWSIVYHTLNGVRHLFWDAGQGFRIPTANLTGWLVLFLSIVIALAIWLLGGLTLGVNVADLAGGAQ